MRVTFTNHYHFLLLSSFLLLVSCNSGNKNASASGIFSDDYLDVATFKTSVQQSLPACNNNDSLFNSQILKDTNGMFNAAYAYKLNDYQPLWMDASGIKPCAVTLIAQLKSLEEDGMDIGKYQIAHLQSEIEQVREKKELPVDTLVSFDKDFTKTWLLAAKDLLLGTRDMHKGDSLWFAKNDTLFNGAEILVASIKANEELPPLDTFRPDSKIYLQMKKAMVQWHGLKNDTAYVDLKKNISASIDEQTFMSLFKKELPNVSPAANDTLSNVQNWIATYQYYHQLKTNGLLDSNTIACLKRMPDDYISNIKLNMDRIRSLPKHLEGEHVWVTIPLMEVDYIKDDAILFHGKVVVGKLSRQTPTLWANMTNVVFNPPWGVPPTILRNDIGPGVSRSGGGYLRRKGLRAFDSKGRDVTGSVNGSNYKRYSYRQPPGAGNALGEVKFNLPNPFDIYLHDTPHRENFASRSRALSSGCVRVQNPKLLAEAILNDEQYTADKIDTIVQTRKTKIEKLNRRLPVYIIYATIAEDSTGNQLRYLADVYKRDERVLKFY